MVHPLLLALAGVQLPLAVLQWFDWTKKTLIQQKINKKNWDVTLQILIVLVTNVS